MFEILFVLGALLLFGFFGHWLFQRTRIPEPVILIAFGFLFGEIGLLWLAPGGISPELIMSLAPPFGAIAIVFFLFEAGISLNLQDVIKQLSFSTVFGLANILLSFCICAAALFFGFNWSFEAAILAAALLAGPSALSINAMLDRFPATSKTRGVLHLEGMLSTLVTPVLAMAVLHYVSSAAEPSRLIQSVAYSFAFSLLLGAVVGVAWINILKRFKIEKFAYGLTMALMLILFFVDFAMTNIGVVAVTFAGIVVGNYGRVSGLLKVKWDYYFDEEFLAPEREIMMFIKTFFFAYIGLALSASKITWPVVLVGSVLALGLLAARLVSVYFSRFFKRHLFYKEDFVLSTMMSRGILNAALAVFVLLPTYAVPLDFSLPAVFIAIVASMLITTIAINYYERAYRKTLLFRKEIELKNGFKATIRAATSDDLGPLKKFINELVGEGALIGFDRRIKNENDLEVIQKELEKANRGDSIFWVAESEGKMIARVKAEKMPFSERNNVELSIYIAKDFRGAGLGKKMFEMLIEKAKQDLEPKNIYLSVFTKNKPAISLYKSLGFKVIGKFPQWGQLGNKYLDEYYMAYAPKKGKKQ
ncbi:MAG: GNAT family N-acetyltransferase [Candidatus Diapherotrites archaeon]